jgi:WD40 repeat protein
MKAANVLIFAILLGCHDRPRDNSAGNQIESLDISPDDRKVLLLSTCDGATTVFEINVDGRSPRLVLKPSSDEIFSNPRYSPDGKKIVFIKHFKKSFWESTVCVSRRDGTGVQELTHGGELVTEAIFSATGGDVLYCSTKQYNSSKTKGTTDVRGFDIYTIDVRDRKATKLSKLDGLGIDNLSEINEKYILFHLNAGKKSGIYSFERDNPARTLRIFPINGTQESSLLDKPGYVTDRFLVFTALYELYAMNLITRKADLIYDTKGGHLIQMLKGFHTKSRVLFKKFDESRLTCLNTDGTEVTSIDVEFPE